LLDRKPNPGCVPRIDLTQERTRSRASGRAQRPASRFRSPPVRAGPL